MFSCGCARIKVILSRIALIRKSLPIYALVTLLEKIKPELILIDASTPQTLLRCNQLMTIQFATAIQRYINSKAT
jgi:hypothetical protein